MVYLIRENLNEISCVLTRMNDDYNNLGFHAITEYGQNLIKLLCFNSFVAIKIL